MKLHGTHLVYFFHHADCEAVLVIPNFLGCNYCAQFSALRFRKIFSLEIVENVGLGGVSNQMPFL